MKRAGGGTAARLKTKRQEPASLIRQRTTRDLLDGAPVSDGHADRSAHLGFGDQLHPASAAVASDCSGETRAAEVVAPSEPFRLLLLVIRISEEKSQIIRSEL
ncbi:hypothetical protein EVAR_51388_1 [Eumeta japonica]|uniref:Uncharacterized protein n=1 Tax=Eumeta variegata TaxID=151549 RepID=A0A4C1ZVI1_EUMVA|nr:hypothetical protein EVAR_51388_1 [Eumeta japonica]